jgi:hypothetical protein
MRNAHKFSVSVLLGLSSLFLMFLVFSPSVLAHCAGKHGTGHPHCANDGGDDVTPGGEHRSLLVTLRDADGSGDDQIYGDGSAIYSDSEKTVNAQLGGQAQPNKPGFSVGLKKAGRNPRQLTTELTCVSLPDGLNNCSMLPNSVTDDEMSMGVRPYELNCPSVDCPDVFTMGVGSELMSFRANYWNHNIFVEIASNLGGDGSLKPGRCLALMDESQRSAFLQSACGNQNDCNVLVIASDGGDLNEAGAGDGENDEWLVSANESVALICGQLSGSEIIYGMTTLTFEIHAIKE